MRFSKTTDYAFRVMVALARAGNERLSLHTLAETEKIPRKFLEHVVRSLKSAGLVQSTPGPKGGYQLSRDPQLISVAQIVLAVHGPFLPVHQLNTNTLPQHLKDPVERLRLVINDIRAYTHQRLESITLADLAEVEAIGEAREALMYYI